MDYTKTPKVMLETWVTVMREQADAYERQVIKAHVHRDVLLALAAQGIASPDELETQESVVRTGDAYLHVLREQLKGQEEALKKSEEELAEHIASVIRGGSV